MRCWTGGDARVPSTYPTSSRKKALRGSIDLAHPAQRICPVILACKDKDKGAYAILDTNPRLKLALIWTDHGSFREAASELLYDNAQSYKRRTRDPSLPPQPSRMGLKHSTQNVAPCIQKATPRTVQQLPCHPHSMEARRIVADFHDSR